MKRVLLAAAAASLFAAPSFAADSASTGISFEGNVADTCVLTAAAQGATTNASLAGTDVTFTQLADATSADLLASSIVMTFANSYCNYAHDVDLDATNGGLVDTTPVAIAAGSGNFVTRIGYSAVLNWAGSDQVTVAPATADSSSVAAGTVSAIDGTKAAIAGANRGDMTLTVSIAANPGTPVLQGDYAETLTVEMGPAL